MIRAYVASNYPMGGFGVAIAVVDHPPESSINNRPRILHLGGSDPFAVSWEEIPGAEISEPTLRLDDDAARAVLDALTRHYQGAEDTRALRRDYDDERKRVDKLVGALIEAARPDVRRQA